MFRIAGVGEILWDIFPDGPRFGGAPANFSCSTAELARDKARVKMVSAVGKDDLGRKALNALQERGVETDAVQQSSQDTGSVLVELDSAGVATYRFAENTAWDQLAWSDQLEEISENCDAVCFGTLGQRSQCSRETIRRFVSSIPDSALKIFDINLREPFYDDQLIRDSLELANVLKLNDDELKLLARQFSADGSTREVIEHIARQCQLNVVAVTRGEQGAIIWREGAVSDLPGREVQIADTVGAGDAFTAAMTLGLLQDDDTDTVNQRAIATASYVCTQSGATMSMPERLRF